MQTKMKSSANIVTIHSLIGTIKNQAVLSNTEKKNNYFHDRITKHIEIELMLKYHIF